MALDFLMTVGAAPPPAGVITSTIINRNVTSAAPETIQLEFDVSACNFDATSAADEYGLIEYRTTFSEQYTFPRVSNLSALPGNHERAHVVRGPTPQFTARQPGTLTWTVEAWGLVSGVMTRFTGTGSTTIGDPDTVFAGAATIWVSPSSSTVGQPSGSTLVTTMQAAVDLVNGDTAPRRIMLNSADTFPAQDPSARPGNQSQTFIPNGTYDMGAGQNGGTVHIVASGAPVTLPAGFSFNYANPLSPKDFVLQNVNLDGGYRPNITDGVDATFLQNIACPLGYNLVNMIGNTPTQAIFDNCELRGGYTCLRAENGNSAAPSARPLDFITVNDCRLTDWFHIGISAYTGTVYMNVSGSDVACNPLADVTRTRPDGSQDNGGACYRGDTPNAVFAKSDFASSQGWAPINAGQFSKQPCMRFRADGVAGGRVCLTETVTQGGYRPIRLEATNPARPTRGVMLLDSVYILSISQTDVAVETNQSALYARNLIGVIPNYASPERVTGSLVDLVTHNSGLPPLDGTIYADPMRIYNCATLYLGTSQTPSVVDLLGSPNFTDVRNFNNYTYSGSSTASGPFEVTTPLFTAYESGGYFDTRSGVGSRATPVPGTEAPAISAIYPTPQEGAGVLGAATTGLVAALDFAGVERPIGNQDVGPIQVSV